MSHIQPKQLTIFTKEGEEYLLAVLKKLEPKKHGMVIVAGGGELFVGIADDRGMFAPLRVSEPDYFVKPADLPKLLKRIADEQQ